MPYLPSGLMWLALLVSVAVFDFMALERRKPTLSQWAWTMSKRLPWLRPLILIAVLFLAYHLYSKGGN